MRGTCAGRRDRGGFTLIELIAAIGLLAVLGAFLVQLVRNSFRLYSQGERRGQLYHVALPVLDLLEEDLEAVHGGPRGRLLLQAEGFGGGRGTGEGFFLRLVRTPEGGEQEHPHLRHAGTETGAGATWKGEDPGIDEQGSLAPPTGLIEVAYALLQEPDDPEGVLTLYRGSFAPALEPGGFFQPEPGTVFDEAWARERLRAVSSGILGLWALSFGQDSDEWGELDVLEEGGAAGLAHLEWDSTRGILPKERFPLAVGAASREDPRDDVFPRRLRLLLHVARADEPEARLRLALGGGEEVLRVNSTEELPPPEAGERFVKVGHEWLRLGEMDSGAVEVARGQRRTTAGLRRHGPGTPVFAGRLFRKTFAVPARRSWFLGAER